MRLSPLCLSVCSVSIEVEGTEHLRIGVDTSGKRRVITDHLEGWDGLEGRQDALVCVKLDQEVNLLGVDYSADVLKS